MNRGLRRRPRPHPTVGYGHPPEAHRFAPGQSGNPRGRPKGTTSKTPAQPPDRLTQIVLKEAARLITVREGDRTVTLSMTQALIRRLFVDAVKGNPRAQRLVLEAVALSQDEAPRTAEQPRPPLRSSSWTPNLASPRKIAGPRTGIVKLRLTAVSDPQHGGFATGSSPVSWGSLDELFVNLTVSMILLPVGVAR